METTGWVNPPTSTTPDTPLGTPVPSWPSPFQPQHLTEPPEISAQEKYWPSASDSAFATPTTVVGE